MIIAPRFSFARPNDTTPYSIGDLVADSTTAAQATRMRFGTEQLGYRGKINAVQFFTGAANVTLATFNLHIFRIDPGVPANGDNGAYTLASARNLLGTVACDLATGASVGTADKIKRFALATPTLFDLMPANQALYTQIVAAAAYVPAALELFEIALELEGSPA